MRIAIRYRDGSDSLSKREITQIEATGGEMIDAFCHLRGEGRSFHLSRIEAAWDPITGEVIDLYKHLGLTKSSGRKQSPLEQHRLHRPKQRHVGSKTSASYTSPLSTPSSPTMPSQGCLASLVTAASTAVIKKTY